MAIIANPSFSSRSDPGVQGDWHVYHESSGGDFPTSGRSHRDDTSHVVLTVQETLREPHHELGEQVEDDSGRDGRVGHMSASLVVSGAYLLLGGYQQVGANIVTTCVLSMLSSHRPSQEPRQRGSI